LLPLVASLYTTSASAEAWTEFEEGLGKMVFNDMKAREGLVEDPLLLQWVRRVGCDVAAQSSRRHLEYRFYILNTEESNAFSLPGGYVLVTLGLLNHVKSDEQLAGVIGHEVAHSDDRDFSRSLREQAIFLGAQSLLRGDVDDGWIIASQFLQILISLRSSRRHEAQADYVGARLCLRAAYDPNGLIDFLGSLSSQQSAVDRALATHPPGGQRVEATRLRVRELESTDYQSLIEVARSLQQRHHLARAAHFAALAADHFPRENEPPLLLKQIEKQRSNPVASQPLQPVRLPADVQAEVQAEATGVRADAVKLYEAEKKLRAGLADFYEDRQIANALQAAQIFSPELTDDGYVVTLARAYMVLSRAKREAMRQGEVMVRATSVRQGWERIEGDLTCNKEFSCATAKDAEVQQAELQCASAIFLAEARPAVQSATVAVEASARQCRELTVATRMLSAAFLALVASGPDQPLGHINFAAFMLLQTDIAVAESRIRSSERASEKALQAILEQHIRAMQVAMTSLHATSSLALRELDLELVGQRLCVDASEVRAAAENATLGEATAKLLKKQVKPQGLQALQTKDCLLRIAYLDLAAERP
jgi:beta-barrel assembly-enhancing protease